MWKCVERTSIRKSKGDMLTRLSTNPPTIPPAKSPHHPYLTSFCVFCSIFTSLTFTSIHPHPSFFRGQNPPQKSQLPAIAYTKNFIEKIPYMEYFMFNPLSPKKNHPQKSPHRHKFYISKHITKLLTLYCRIILPGEGYLFPEKKRKKSDRKNNANVHPSDRVKKNNTAYTSFANTLPH